MEANGWFLITASESKERKPNRFSPESAGWKAAGTWALQAVSGHRPGTVPRIPLRSSRGKTPTCERTYQRIQDPFTCSEFSKNRDLHAFKVLGIMGRNVFQVLYFKIRRPGNGRTHGGNGGYAASRKDVTLDEIHRALMLIVNLVPDGNRLKHHHAVFLEAVAAAPEKRLQVLVSNSLDHLDGHQFVKPSPSDPDSP